MIDAKKPETMSQRLLVLSVQDDANNLTSEKLLQIETEYEVAKQLAEDQGGNTIAFVLMRLSDDGIQIKATQSIGGSNATSMLMTDYLLQTVKDKFTETKFCTCPKCRLDLAIDLMGNELDLAEKSALRTISEQMRAKKEV